MIRLQSVTGWAWNGFVLAALAGVAVWGHETDWTFTHWAHHGPKAGHEGAADHATADNEAHSPHEVEFDSAAEAADAGIRVTTVTRRDIAEFIAAPAIVTYVPSGIAHLSARVPGTVWRVEHRQGDEVRQGEVLAILDALAVGDAKSKFLQAMVQAELKQQNLDRLQLSADVVSERQLREADAALRETLLERSNAQQALINLGLQAHYEDFSGIDDEERARRMQFLGLPEALVETLDPSTTTANLIPVVAPFDGVLVRCDIVKGEVVSPEHSSLVLANVEKMLVKLSVNKEDVLRVGPGQEVHYLADGIPGRIRCQIRWISTEVDEKTRAVLAIAELENVRVSGHDSREGGRLLKANTFGVGQIRVRESASALVVPDTAVQWNGQRHIVFLAHEETDLSHGHRDWVFEARPVAVGTLHDGFAEIVSGLEEGTQIVVDGSHMLKSELIRRLSHKPQ